MQIHDICNANYFIARNCPSKSFAYFIIMLFYLYHKLIHK